LEFKIPTHWTVFADAVATRKTQRPLTVFLDRDAIQAWASHLDLGVDFIRDGNDAFVPLPHPLRLEAGTVMEKFGYLGQSICVLSVPSTSSPDSHRP
jgi:hypothetical protein